MNDPDRQLVEALAVELERLSITARARVAAIPADRLSDLDYWRDVSKLFDNLATTLRTDFEIAETCPVFDAPEDWRDEDEEDGDPRLMDGWTEDNMRARAERGDGE